MNSQLNRKLKNLDERYYSYYNLDPNHKQPDLRKNPDPTIHFDKRPSRNPDQEPNRGPEVDPDGNPSRNPNHPSQHIPQNDPDSEKPIPVKLAWNRDTTRTSSPSIVNDTPCR